jgi:hypothetical protein
MKSLLGLAFCCALAAQTPEAAKATISNLGSEPAPYIPDDAPKPTDTYSQAFVTRPVAVIEQPVIEQEIIVQVQPIWLTALRAFTPRLSRAHAPARRHTGRK